MKCPSCAADGPDEAPECPACGVNFAKWKAKAEKAAAEAAAAAAAAAAAPPASQPPSSRSTLLTTVGVLVVACLAVYGAYDYASRTMAPAEEKGGVLIKPDAYRPRIQAIEGALYKAGPATLSDAKAISNAASQLAGVILERHSQNPFARAAIGDLMEFSGMAAPEDGAALAADARAEWTRRWETLRAQRFEKAPWFHAAVSKDDGPPPDFERAAARILSAGHRLKAQLAAVPAEFEKFSVDDVNLADRERDAGRLAGELEAWRAWRADWQGRVDEALNGFPEPGEVPRELRAAYDTLVRAAQEARNPPNPGPGVPASGAAAKEIYQPGKERRDAWLSDINGWVSGLDESIKGVREAKLEAK